MKYYWCTAVSVSTDREKYIYMSVSVWNNWQVVGGNMCISIWMENPFIMKTIYSYMTIRQTPENKSERKGGDENAKSWQITEIRDSFLNLLMVCFPRLMVIRYHMFSSSPAALRAWLFQIQAARSAVSAAFGNVLSFHKSC